MKSKCFLQLITLSFLIFCQNTAFAASVSADKARLWSESKGQELIKTLAEESLAEKYVKLDDLFLNYIDLDHIGRFVMGKFWKDMTDGQKEVYMPLFKRYSLALYKGFPINFNEEDIDFNITKVAVESSYTIVAINITLRAIQDEKSKEDMNILVEFRLHEKSENILLTDLKIAETSFILTYRNRFAQMIASNDNDIEWFLEDLETSTKSIEKNNELLINKQELTKNE